MMRIRGLLYTLRWLLDRWCAERESERDYRFFEAWLETWGPEPADEGEDCPDYKPSASPSRVRSEAAFLEAWR